jgi:hypothetical protein
MAQTLVRDRTLKLSVDPKYDPLQLRQLYACRAYQAGPGEFVEGHGVSAIQINRGRLQVDDIPVLAPRITPEGISWYQQATRRFTSGFLAFDKGGVELHGVVFTGTSAADAVPHDVLATTIKPVAYSTRITKQRQPVDLAPGSLPADDWKDGLVLKIG